MEIEQVSYFLTRKIDLHRDELLHVGEQVHNMLHDYDSFFGKLENELGVSIFHTAFKNLNKRFDGEFGGFGKAPKFPPSMQLVRMNELVL